MDYVQQIIEAFESQGPTQAWQTYQRVRKQAGKKLTIDDRRELLRLAAGQGFHSFAAQIVAHAKEDFPNSTGSGQLASELKKLIKNPSGRVQVDRDGIRYIEFAIENRTSNKIDTFVRGPKPRQFSYGIPFPAGKVRNEKWPVGTKLFWSENDNPGTLILTVDETMAGQTVGITPEPTK